MSFTNIVEMKMATRLKWPSGEFAEQDAQVQNTKWYKVGHMIDVSPQTIMVDGIPQHVKDLCL